MTKPRFGFWLPIFGGWLRNVEDEDMPATFSYALDVARQAEEWGYTTALVAELNLNDIKGVDQPVLEAWTTSAALAATTRNLEIMAAIRPGFRNPAIVAKMAANIDNISGGRFTLNVVSAWWAEEARRYGMDFVPHDERYARTTEFIDVMKGMWAGGPFSFHGQYYNVDDGVLAPHPMQQPWPRLYAGGESETARTMIATQCDAYLMHGDTPEAVAARVADMRARRDALRLPPLSFGMAAYAIVRDSAAEADEEIARITNVRDAAGYAGYGDFTSHSQLEREISLRDYSVSNRGLRPGLIGTPETVAARVREFADAGIDLFLLQCSPMHTELERFARQVMPLV
jgi:FMNH2-dependent dimethyl sulfone monooxygenase